METAEQLKEIIARQKDVLSDLQAAHETLENSDLSKENAGLRTQLEALRADVDELDDRANRLAEENKRLKSALYEQVYSEKVKLVNVTQQKMEVYFQSQVREERNRLSALEGKIRTRIDGIRAEMVRSQIDIKDSLNEALEEASALLDQKMTQAKALVPEPPAPFTQEERDALEALREEPLNEAQLGDLAKKNNLERFVGLNVLNVLGILLLLFGAITLARFTYVQLTPLFKGVLLFGLGGLLLAFGELLNRRKPNAFSLGISAGGIAILYAALTMSYFYLGILGMYPALLICVLITAGAFLLSDRYHSEVIAAFALLGGYLPILSLEVPGAVAYGAMVYFVALNLLALLLSLRNRWRIASFLGLALNIAATAYICLLFRPAEDTPTKILTLCYILFAFLVYTAIPLLGSVRTRTPFKRADLVFLSANTAFSSLILYGAFYSFGFAAYDGLFALFFAAVYLLVGRLVEKRFAEGEGRVRALFYLTGLAFVVLVVPLQFGTMWLSLGWLIEGVLLAVYGIMTQEKRLTRVGLVVCGLCLAAFVVFDCNMAWHPLFVWKYLAITLGSLGILGAYMGRREMTGPFVRRYKYVALGNVWLFSMYLLFEKLQSHLWVAFQSGAMYRAGYFTGAAAVVLTFLLAYGFLRIRLLADRGTKVLSLTLYALGILGLFALNRMTMPLSGGSLTSHHWGAILLGSVLVAVPALLSVPALADGMKVLLLERKRGLEWYPLAISGYFVLLLTCILVWQVDLAFSNAAISILYVLTALLWIIFGFLRRFVMIRRFGLALAIVAVVKLFLVDLWGLTEGYRIVSYFALGLTLIAISFVYQYFSRKLERKEERTHVENDS